MADSNLNILINAKNNASAPIKQVKSDVQGLSQVGGAVGSAFGLALGATVAGGIMAIGGAMMSAAADGAKLQMRFETVNQSFQVLTRNAGVSSTQMMAAMRQASNGMISDTDLVLSANKAMMLGVADTSNEMASLLEISASRGRAFGMDASQAFEQIVTGLGRLSPRILDNLGIVMDETAVYGAYAQSIRKTADALSEAEKRQALLNEVIKQSANLKSGMPTGAAASQSQLQVSEESAKMALGKMALPSWREWADAQADTINQLMGSFDAYAAKVRDVSQIAVDIANDDRSSSTQKDRWRDLAEAAQQVLRAQQSGLPVANNYANAITNIANQAELSRSITADQAVVVRQLSTAIQAEVTAFNMASAAIDILDPKLDQIRAKEQALAFAANQAAAAHRAMSAAFAMGVPSASAIPGGRGADYFAGRNAVVDPLQGQIDSMAARLVPVQGQQAALDWARQQKLELRSQADALYEQGYTWAQIGNVLMPAVVDETGNWVGEVTKVNSGASELKKQYDDILSTVKSIITENQKFDLKAGDFLTPDELKKQGLNYDSPLPLDGAGGRPDAINENARRLAAIAKEGFTEQPWLEEFKREVPGVYADLVIKQAEGMDLRSAAFDIMRQFQDGLRPELMDKGAIKEKVKALIIGDQNAAALATEIATELAAEMNIPISQALAAAGSAMGVKTGPAGEAAAGAAGAAVAPPDMTGQGSAAGATFMAGFQASVTGTGLVVTMVSQMETAVLSWKTPGQNAGAMWGGGFMSTVETGMAPALITLLATLVTPGVLAAIQAGTSQTTPPDGGTP